MDYEEKTPLTADQRAALKPVFQKLESGFQELEKSLAAFRRNPDEDPGGGFCGLDDGCSSFLGPHPTLDSRCERPFCRHKYRYHLT